MTIERVTKHIIPDLLILLDSKKAFNQVEHSYIWAVLKKIGLGAPFYYK